MPRKANAKNMGRAANGLGSIRKRTVTRNGKNYSYWEARCTVGFDPGTGKQIQRSISGKTQKEVAQRMKELSVEVDQGTYLAPSKMTVSEWLKIWRENYLNRVKQSTVFLYGENCRLYIEPAIGTIRLDALNTHSIQAFYNELYEPKKKDKNPLSAKTIKNIHGVFHKALQQAVSIGYLRFNPADACILPRVVRKEIHPLEETQITAFLAAIQGHVHENLYKIDLFTGMRQGEILGLTWDCVDLTKGTLEIKQQLRREQKKGGGYYFSSPKNNKSRTLTLAPTVIQTFRAQKVRQAEMQLMAGSDWNNEYNLVFTNPTGGYCSYRTVYDCFKRIVDSIGTPTTRFHDLRHTYAVAAIQSGDDIKTVQENLGHATAAFTLDVYGHVTAHMKQESASRMERFIQSVSGG